MSKIPWMYFIIVKPVSWRISWGVRWKHKPEFILIYFFFAHNFNQIGSSELFVAQIGSSVAAFEQDDQNIIRKKQIIKKTKKLSTSLFLTELHTGNEGMFWKASCLETLVGKWAESGLTNIWHENVLHRFSGGEQDMCVVLQN